MPSVFISCVSSEFREYRQRLANELRTLRIGEIFDQETFRDGSTQLLDHIDHHIRASDLVVHLLGQRPGFKPTDGERLVFQERHPPLPQFFASNQPRVDPSGLSYTQWEYWLAQHYGKECFVYEVASDAQSNAPPTDAELAAQAAHRERIIASGQCRYEITHGPWELVARTFAHLTGSKTELLRNSTRTDPTDKWSDKVVIVIGISLENGNYLIRAWIRWRGAYMRISDVREVPRRNEVLLARNLTEVISCGIDTVEVGATPADLDIELVLCKNLILEPPGRWCVNSGTGARRPLRGLHSVRVRYGTRWADRNATHLIKKRLETLAKDLTTPIGIRWPIDEFLADCPETTPISVVHCSQAAQVNWWEQRNIVCAAFTRKPKTIRQPLKMRGKVAAEQRSVPIVDALDFGIPYLMWPNQDDAEVSGKELLGHMEKCQRPELLIDYLRRRAQLDYSVVADCQESPLPRDRVYFSEVQTSAGGS